LRAVQKRVGKGGPFPKKELEEKMNMSDWRRGGENQQEKELGTKKKKGKVRNRN